MARTLNPIKLAHEGFVNEVSNKFISIRKNKRNNIFYIIFKDFGVDPGAWGETAQII